jgi:uncharacterized membrane protein
MNIRSDGHSQIGIIIMIEELTIILIGATPVSELRGAIPLALGLFNFSPAKAYFLSVLGNLLPIIPAFFIYHLASGFLMERSGFFKNFFTKIFEKTREKYQTRFKHDDKKIHLRPWFEMLTLFLFVAIPLPFTGIWTATLVAFVFGVPVRRAFFSMLAGVLFAGGIVLGLSLGVISLF